MKSDVPKDVTALLEKCREETRYRKGVKAGEVPVDSGCVEFTFDGRLAQGRMTALHEKVFEMSLGTAKAGFDGTRGYVGVENDGELEIIECRGINPPAGRKTRFIGSVSTNAAKEIGLGDCGKVYVRLKLTRCMVSFYREDGDRNGKLWVCV